MTAKPTASDGEGPGVRAHQAKMRKWWKAGALYAVAASALIAILVLGRRDTNVDGIWLEPEAAIASAVLLPILTSVTMWFCLRMSDEFQRRLIIDAWAASFIVVMFGAVSWAFLLAGGVLAEPPPRAVFGMLMLGAGASVVLACCWFQWRRS